MTLPTITPKVYFKLPVTYSLNLVNNHSFESLAGANDFWNWSEYGTVTDETTLVQDGNHAAKMVWAGSGQIPYVSQTITGLTAGNEYRLSFWSRGDGSNAPTYKVRDVTNGADIITTTGTTTSTTYTKTTVEFTTPSGCTSIYIMFRVQYPLGTTVTGYVDHVELYDITDVWELCDDVLSTPFLTWETGILGSEPLDLVASTGIGSIYLDNSYDNKYVAAYQSEHDINGDFEDVTGDDFAKWGEVENGGTVEDDQVNQHGGDHCVHIVNPAADYAYVYVETDDDIPAGSEVIVTFWVKGDYYLSLSDEGSGETEASGTEAAWAQKTLSMVMTATGKLGVYIDAGPYLGEGWFDDVVVNETIPASGRLPGQYSPGHTNVLDGFGEGTPVKIVLDYDAREYTTVTANMLTNGGFETAGGGGADVFAEWTEGAFVGFGTITDETVTIHGGSHSAKITNGVAYPDMYLDVTKAATVGRRYTLTGWVKGYYYVVLYTNESVYETTSGYVADWTQITLSCTSDDTTIGIMLFVGTAPGTCYYDDFVLKEESVAYTAGTPTKFIGTINSIRPSSGLFDNPISEVTVHDWIGYLNTQELGVHAIQTTKGADDAITTALTEFPIQPEDTDFDIGVEDFPVIFNTDISTVSMASFFQKMARNEMGRIYCKGDGTLVFENRDARPLTTTSSFTLDGTMTEFDVSYNSGKMFNTVQARINPTKTDSAATTVLWALSGDGILIRAGQTLTLRCKFSDPDTGIPISGTDVVNPIATGQYKFGTAQDSSSDNLHADLSQSNTVGGNDIVCALTNNAAVDGYLNEFNVQGKGIYTYDAITLEVSDTDSIDLVGEHKFLTKLEQIVDPNTARNYAAFIEGNYSQSHIDTCRVRVLANQTKALFNGLVQADISTRFTITESVTGVNRDFYVNRLKYEFQDGLLWVTIWAQASNVDGAFIWDTSHWDSEEDGRWML